MSLARGSYKHVAPLEQTLFLTSFYSACYTLELLISVLMVRKQPESSRSGFRRGHAQE